MNVGIPALLGRCRRLAGNSGSFRAARGDETIERECCVVITDAQEVGPWTEGTRFCTGRVEWRTQDNRSSREGTHRVTESVSNGERCLAHPSFKPGDGRLLRFVSQSDSREGTAP